MAKKTIIIAISALAVFLLAFGHYTHRGYLGVLEAGASLRLLEHGFHLRAPWQRVTAYPVQCRAIRVEIFDDGPGAKIHFDAVLYVGIARDSVISLHRAYDGAYMEKVISPLISSFLRDYGEAYGLWDDDVGPQRVTGVMLDLLGAEGRKYGINVTNMWLRSYEAERTSGTF
jgi:hypothetical protein